MGLGFLALANDMAVEEARKYIEGKNGDLYFDYVKGRPLKIDLSDDIVNTRFYDRDQGQGLAAKVIADLRNNIIKSTGLEPKPQNEFEQFALDYKEGKFPNKDLDEAMQEQNIDSGIRIIGATVDNDYNISFTEY